MVSKFLCFYKDQSLFEVLSAIGLSETDLQTEALRFIQKLWMPLMSTVFWNRYFKRS